MGGSLGNRGSARALRVHGDLPNVRVRLDPRACAGNTAHRAAPVWLASCPLPLPSFLSAVCPVLSLPQQVPGWSRAGAGPRGPGTTLEPEEGRGLWWWSLPPALVPGRASREAGTACRLSLNLRHPSHRRGSTHGRGPAAGERQGPGPACACLPEPFPGVLPKCLSPPGGHSWSVISRPPSPAPAGPCGRCALPAVSPGLGAAGGVWAGAV